MRKHQLARRFDGVLGMHRHFALHLVAQGLLARRVVLFLGDEAFLAHAAEDELLAYRGALRVDDRVVGRWCHRQPGQHRGLGHAQVAHRLAEVDLAGCGEAIGALPQEDLVHVQLEDLLLGQQLLDLQRQQQLVDLARVGLLGGQVEVLRHLHRDGRAALAACVAQVGQRCARDAFVVDAAVLVEARVLGGEHRVLHYLRHLRDRCEVAPFFTKFAKQHAVSSVDSHRQFGTVIHQTADLGHVRVGHGHCDARQDQHAQHAGSDQTEGPHDDPTQPTNPNAARCAGAGVGGRGGVFGCGAFGAQWGTFALRVAGFAVAAARRADRRPARLAGIIESACTPAPCFEAGLRTAFDAARRAQRRVLRKAQLRDVSGAVPGVGESQRGADFRDCFALGHKGFTASIQVTY